MEQLSTHSSEFTLDIYKKCCLNTNDNVVISPFSISTALAMTYAGARGNTATEMKEALKLALFPADEDIHKAFEGALLSLLKPKDEKYVRLNIANRMYLQSGTNLLSEFKSILETNYKSPSVQVDFINQSADITTEINKWVEDQTNTKIKDIIAPGILNELTRLVLVNAIYFKCIWNKPFWKSESKPGDFYVNDSNKVTVTFMHRKRGFMCGQDTDNLKCKILELQFYYNTGYSMFFILPIDVNGLNELESKLNVIALHSLMNEMYETEVDVILPKFRIEAYMNLNDILKNLGVKDLFDENRADLSGITGARDLFCSNVLHKTFLEVDEQGCEAAASTVVIGEPCCLVMYPKPPMTFNADHPFITFVRHNETKTILFWGRLINPTN